MKALSIKQPWANLIATGKKTIETRTWATPYRGEILLVSSRSPRIHPAGFALVVANLVECRPMTEIDRDAAQCDVYPGAFSWVFKDIRSIEPFAVKGQLGLFDVHVRPEQLTPPHFLFRQ